MANEKFYPSVASLVTLDNLPEQLGFIKNGISALFSNLYYRDLQVAKSTRGESAHYSLSIVSLQRIDIEIPGTGIFLVLNPGHSSISSFPITLSYEWPILAYIRGFNLGTFSFQAGDFYDLALKILGISEAELISRAMNIFLSGANPVNQVVDDINNFYELNQAPINNPIPYPVSTNPVAELVAAIRNHPDLGQSGQNVSLVVFSLYILDSLSEGNTKEKMNAFFQSFFGDSAEDYIKRLITPKMQASLKLAVAIEFPRNILVPLDGNGVPLPNPNDKSMLVFSNVTDPSFTFSTERGIGYDVNLGASLNHPSQIGDTGFTIDIQNAKLDISRETNIPEADADGRPKDFVGVFIQSASIGLPKFFSSSSNPSTTYIEGKNLLIGTGGISGTLGLNNPNGIISAKLGNFEIELNGFSVNLHQSRIIDSNIKGKLTIKGFKDAANQTSDAVINLDVHIGSDGVFDATASAVQAITALRIPNVFDFKIKSLSIGRNSSDKFYVAVSGNLDLLVQGQLGKFLPDDIEIKQLIIYDDGTFEFKGGAITFPKAYTLTLGPAKLSISAIHLGSHEQEKGGVMRKYKYFGFDGGVSVNPGGVDVRGKGVKFYFTTDGGPYDFFIRIQSLAIDLIIPGSAKPEDAAVILKGYLAMKEPQIPPSATPAERAVLENSTEYIGGVSLKIPKMKGLEGMAAMRFNPKVPSFIIDIGIEISTPIVLGSTGLGIYGFRALLGKKYVASKESIPLDDDAEWWQYYKAKIDPDFKEGIQVSKFVPKQGFSLGAGVSLATSSDSGKTFSSKLFLLLSLPDVFLFQGQAQFLKNRIGLNDPPPEPPFFTIIAITKQSVEAAFGVNYKMPDDGATPGKVFTLDGVTELGFFFGNSTSWYFNIGRETPAERRIQARVLDLFNMYFYFMISSSGIRAGAGASFEQKKNFGPLKAELKAYMDIAGRISFKPKQIGGSIQTGGNVSLKIFKFGFSFSIYAGLAAESPKPRIVTGSFEVCVKVLKKEYCAHFELTWNFDNNLDFSENQIIEPGAVQNAAKTSNILTGETLNLFALSFPNTPAGSVSIPEPASWTGGANKYIVPLDSFIDIEFKKGLKVNGPDPSLARFGGVLTGASFTEFIAPQRGKSDRVRHEYIVNKIEILYYDSNNAASGSSPWTNYDFYSALTPQQNAGFVNQTALQNLKYGYWQIDEPGKYNKLKVLAQNPVTFIKEGVLPEDFGITDQTIFCGEEPREKVCVNFDDRSIPAIIPADKIHFFKEMIFRIVGEDGKVIALPYGGFQNALSLHEKDIIEVYFEESAVELDILMQTFAPDVTISYYTRTTQDPADINSLPTYSYTLIKTDVIPASSLNNPVHYSDIDKPVDKLEIKAGICKPDPNSKLYCTANVSIEGKYIEKFLSQLARNRHLLQKFFFLYPEWDRVYNGYYQNTPLYSKPLQKGDTLSYSLVKSQENRLEFVIRDNTGYSCTFTLELPVWQQGFGFALIREFTNIRPDTSTQQAGNNYDFLIDAVIIDNNGVQHLYTLKGRSCHVISVCSEHCSTLIYDFCFLNFTDYVYNQTIPPASQVSQDSTNMVEAITKTLQPVWRPNTHYAVRMEVTDNRYRETSGSINTSSVNTFVFGFKTAGPVGHYHEFPAAPDQSQVRTDYQDLLTKDREAEFKLSTLNLYIDYPKCYPNADGQLINAKPLFYKNPKLLMFYTKPYVYQFYNDWSSYGNLEPVNSKLDVIIKDPAEPEFTGSQLTAPPSGTTAWVTTQNLIPHSEQIIGNDVNILSNMLQNGNPCISQPQLPLTPIQIANEITFNDLLPEKLYTAIYNARFKRTLTDTKDLVREVHRHVFETSRYGDFEEQVKSYILKSHLDTNNNLVIDKQAVFTLETSLTASQLADAAQFVANPDSVADTLVQQFGHPYDRLIDGILSIRSSVNPSQSLEPAVCTEFNFIKDTVTGKTIGVLVRSPEPFNDPKMPSSVIQTTLSLTHTDLSNTITTSYKVFFAKDNAKAFITNDDASLDMPAAGECKFTFLYKQYDGAQYSTVGSPVDVIINL
jgi:hypothetical protein